MKDKMIAQLTINKKQYSIRATGHSIERMAERDIDEEIVVGNIMALGREKIIQLQNEEAEAIIIDENTNSSIVIGFKKNKIQVITVINKANVFVKEGTEVVNL